MNEDVLTQICAPGIPSTRGLAPRESKPDDEAATAALASLPALFGYGVLSFAQTGLNRA